MSQHLPTSISHTKLEIATYIHELADKLLPSTTSQYILLGTTQLAPNTTLHYKACKTRLLPSTTLYHKTCTQVLPSTTLYYKACTKSFPVYYNLQLHNWISTPKRQTTILKHFLKGILKGTNYQRQNWDPNHPLTHHYRSLDAAIPIRFTIFSCKRQ